MDYQNQSLDQMVKRDKKLGRVRGQGQPRPNQRGNQAPLPGRGRGGANNGQRGRQQQNRVRQTTNGISKQNTQRPQQRQNQQQKNNQGVDSQRQRQNQPRRLMGDRPMNNQQNQNQGNQGGQQRRQTLQNLRQNKRTRGRRAQTGNQNLPRSQVNQQPPLRNRAPKVNAAPRAQPKQQMAQNQPQKQQLSQTLSVVQGTLAERKLRVRGIDSRVVTQSDLQKLFSKCGPMINASFDTNEFGSYLGTATVIYSRASAANRAIKEYNMAKIDQRPMKVQFAIQTAAQKPNNQTPRQQPAKQQQQMPAIRRTNGRISKTGQGKTLNVMGGQRRQRGSRQ